MADERGMSLEAFGRYAEDHPDVDRELDRRQLMLASRHNVILEGRMSGFLLHRSGRPSFRVWLEADFEERVRRIAERENGDPKAIAEEIRERERCERERYRSTYGFDPWDRSYYTIYNLVVNTTQIPAKMVADIIQSEYERWKEPEHE